MEIKKAKAALLWAQYPQSASENVSELRLRFGSSCKPSQSFMMHQYQQSSQSFWKMESNKQRGANEYSSAS
jgi:hypothetical protein